MDLNNDHNVYILGAGFSRDAGLPLISDFLNQMRDSHDVLAKSSKREAKAIESVLQFRLKATSAAYWVQMDLENIEELFSLASASPEPLHDKLRLAVAATLKVAGAKKSLSAKLEIRQSDAERMFSGVPPWLVPDKGRESGRNDGSCFTVKLYTYYVAALLGMDAVGGECRGENTFITFNYDTLVEESLTQLGLEYYTGINGPSGGLKDPMSGSGGRLMKGIPVLKLHGSVNWAKLRGGKRLASFQSYQNVLDQGLVPGLIPPTWKKSFGGGIDEVWKAAVNQLRSASRIVIIGFSMPPMDSHFRFLLAAGLKDNISLREVVLINPEESDELRDRVKSVLRKEYCDGPKIRICRKSLRSFVTGQASGQSDLDLIGRGLPSNLTHILSGPS